MTKINTSAAMTAALKYADVGAEEIFDRKVILENGLYYIRFRTLYMIYEAFVDAHTGEVPGFNYEPAPPAFSCDIIGAAA